MQAKLRMKIRLPPTGENGYTSRPVVRAQSNLTGCQTKIQYPPVTIPMKKLIPFSTLLILAVLTSATLAQNESPSDSDPISLETQGPGESETIWFGEETTPQLIQPGQCSDCNNPSIATYPPVQTPVPTQTHWGAAPQRSPWYWQVVPDGLTFPAYLASGNESRMGSVWSYEKDHGWLWDVALGGHVGILRYGDDDPALPFGWQIDIEGAAFPRLDLQSERQMMATDFRFGVPLSLRQGCFETKLAYYHLSSHLGDDFIAENPGHPAINYVRDVVVWAVGLRLIENVRAYAEAGYAFYRKGGSKPWEFQFGVDWSQVRPESRFGSPFFAVNGRIREEVDFGGNLTAQTGWQWRGETGNLLRLGFHYFNGKSDAYQFFTEHEEHFGIGLWYDF